MQAYEVFTNIYEWRIIDKCNLYGYILTHKVTAINEKNYFVKRWN